MPALGKGFAAFLLGRLVCLERAGVASASGRQFFGQNQAL